MPKQKKELFNPHSVGIILKELVRRAIIAIRNERFKFEISPKQGYDGEMNDVCTTADKKAQGIYLKSLGECFGGYGIVAEEDDLRIPCQVEGHDIFFTVDPLDGTRAFTRGQSHGVGTMIALVVDGQVAAAYVGDVNTKEIYGYRPGSDNVHRITEFETFKTLGLGDRLPLDRGYLLLRELPEFYGPAVLNLVRGGKFKNINVDGGSIGIWMSRLWKGEVAGVVLEPSIETPWDSTPVIGISQKLGFVFLRPDKNGWVQYEPLISKKIYRRDHPALVIHSSQVDQL